MNISDHAAETLRDMRQLSDAADNANGTSGYHTALIALALVAREFLRRVSDAAPAAPPAWTDHTQRDIDRENR